MSSSCHKNSSVTGHCADMEDMGPHDTTGHTDAGTSSVGYEICHRFDRTNGAEGLKYIVGRPPFHTNRYTRKARYLLVDYSRDISIALEVESRHQHSAAGSTLNLHLSTIS